MESKIDIQSWFKINRKGTWLRFKNSYMIIGKENYTIIGKKSSIGKEPSTSLLYITLYNFYLNCVYISFYRNGYCIDHQKEYTSSGQDIGAAGKWLTKQVRQIVKEATEVCKMQKTVTNINEKIVLKRGFKISINFISEGELLLFLVPKLEELIKKYEEYTSNS